MSSRSLMQRAMRLASTCTKTRIFIPPQRRLLELQAPTPHVRCASHTTTSPAHNLSSSAEVDRTIEDITELFATAQDEFEIAMEETEKVSVYAEDDRNAAREELDKVLEAYRLAVDGPDATLAEAVRRRIGHRIRELEEGVKRMEELATQQD